MTALPTEAPNVPGLVLRIYGGGLEEAARMAPLATAANAAEDVDEVVAASELEHWLGHRTDSFDPSSDVVLAEVGDALVGYAWVAWVDTTDGLREFRLGGHVDPGWQGRGIGRRLLAWQEQRAREHPAAGTGPPCHFATWAPDSRVKKQRLFERAGYQAARYAFSMRRPTLDDVVLPPMPEGLEVRPIGLDRASQRQMWDADVEAFQDHWGGFDASEAAFENSLTAPNRDPLLWIVAWDGDAIAGGVTNAIFADDNEAFGQRRGWLDTVFVRRKWRRRGLGAAIVARALLRLREAGMNEAMLGVDSENPSGALGLYERAGFVVDRRETAYRKPMEVA
jgi:Acetyltransferase (GNAT) family.